MINVPTLYERDERTRKMKDIMLPTAPNIVSRWVGMEILPGAEVRITTRNRTVVRLEAIRRPTPDQKKEGIYEPWYADVHPNDPKGYWLWKAVEGTSLGGLTDGEWSGEAIGENINNNPLGVEGHRIVFTSLFPWRDTMDVEVAPSLGRTPVDFDELRYWLATTPTSFQGGTNKSVPMAGILWWLDDTPYAQVRSKDFPALRRPPNPMAELPDTVMDISEIIDWDEISREIT